MEAKARGTAALSFPFLLDSSIFVLEKNQYDLLHNILPDFSRPKEPKPFMLNATFMDLEKFKVEIRDLIRNAKSRTAAEKLLAACKPNSSLHHASKVCLSRLEKLDKDKMYYMEKGLSMESGVYEGYRASKNQVLFALLSIVRKLTPEELESN